jgi:hypothetical protein
MQKIIFNNVFFNTNRIFLTNNYTFIMKLSRNDSIKIFTIKLLAASIVQLIVTSKSSTNMLNFIRINTNNSDHNTLPNIPDHTKPPNIIISNAVSDNSLNFPKSQTLTMRKKRSGSKKPIKNECCEIRKKSQKKRHKYTCYTD